MSEEQWNEGFAKSLGVFLNGESISRPGLHGERIVDDSFYLLFNAHHEPLTFTLPAAEWGQQWICVLDTNDAVPQEHSEHLSAGQQVQVPHYGLRVLKHIAE
jgi:glycogen operon protein